MVMGGPAGMGLHFMVGMPALAPGSPEQSVSISHSPDPTCIPSPAQGISYLHFLAFFKVCLHRVWNGRQLDVKAQMRV